VEGRSQLGGEAPGGLGAAGVGLGGQGGCAAGQRVEQAPLLAQPGRAAAKQQQLLHVLPLVRVPVHDGGHGEHDDGDHDQGDDNVATTSIHPVSALPAPPRPAPSSPPHTPSIPPALTSAYAR
jgi:hypothetical protein